jgi:hypothetical protein
MTISLDHVELTSADNPSYISDEHTMLRYWQARIPGTELYAITEEAFTNTGEGNYIHTTRFFVCSRPASDSGPAGAALIQDDTNSYGQGLIGDAIRALTGPHTWDDAPRQRMLAEALDRAAQNA